jgi:hypothetical protein
MHVGMHGGAATSTMCITDSTSDEPANQLCPSLPVFLQFSTPAALTDFATVADMTKWLSTSDAKTAPALKDIRSLASSSVRVAVALPATSFTGGARVAKERAALP